MIEVIGITKHYPGTVALDNISLKFEQGHVHALIGKNGAGKSTLVKILAGAIKPANGQIFIDGQKVVINSPLDSLNKGIATVYQELSLVPEMTIAENILLGRIPKRKLLGKSIIDWSEVFSQAKKILAGMNVDLDVKKKASELSIAQQQIVEIAKAMSFNPSALIFDEPTSALAYKEVQQLFKLIKELAGKGVVVIYITHRLQELCEIADTVTVLRDGNYIGSVKMAETTNEEIVQMMFGEAVQKQGPEYLSSGDETVMKVRNLGKKGKLQDVNFNLYKGEILGIAGTLGSGRTELLKAVFGAEPFEEGWIEFKGEIIKSPATGKMKKLGIAFTPENRKEEALVLIHSVRANMSLAALEKLSVKGLITAKMETRVVEKYVEKLDIQVSDIESNVNSLSGGNQQKVVLGNWLNTDPDVILLDEPTRGIDVRAKQQIFQIIRNLRKSGIGFIVVSSELDELLEICHRILIMKKGRIVNQVSSAEVSADKLFLMCMAS